MFSTKDNSRTRKSLLLARDNLFNKGRYGASDILKQSKRATCGTFEREVTVPSSRVASTKKRLKEAGFMIVGTSESNGSTRKIWFVPYGSAGI